MSRRSPQLKRALRVNREKRKQFSNMLGCSGVVRDRGSKNKQLVGFNRGYIAALDAVEKAYPGQVVSPAGIQTDNRSQ